MKRKKTAAELEARRRMNANTERTRRLADEGLAKLPARACAERERAGSNHGWLRTLAEQAQAELERRKSQQA
jgi:hypothetical protein